MLRGGIEGFVLFPLCFIFKVYHMIKIFLTLVLLLLPLSLAADSEAKVFMKRDEALKTAFPDADNIEKTNIFLTKEQVSEIESLAKAKLDSRLYIIYEGKRGVESLGYAIIDTHHLRTKSETVMFVINPDGTLRKAEILAFFEPPEYMAGDKWMNLFDGKDVENNSLRLGKDIPNITGATITANSLTSSIRRVLAVFNVATDNGLLFSEAGN